MTNKITITITEGHDKGKTFVFEQYDLLTIGRGKDCQIRLSKDKTVSRQHCLLEISPPQIRMRDLGSAWGTRVNGVKYGGRGKGESVEEGARRAYPEVDLQAGDEIQVGKSYRLHVAIEVTATEVAQPVLETTISWPPPTPPLDPTVQWSPPNPNLPPTEHWPPNPLKSNAQAVSPHAQMALLKDLRVRTAEEVPFLGHYLIKKELGRGGFGAVYLAQDRQTRQPVALKVMAPKVAVTAQMEINFKREVKIAKRLHHPHVVDLLEDGNVGDVYYFMMSYCEGGNLADLMRASGGRISLREGVPLMHQALAGLAHVHAQNIVHRDIKPQNILLTRTPNGWQVKIADFGLAKGFTQAGLSGITVTGAYAGTRPFMPREQLTDYRDAKPVTDVWSIAATFYLMLTGRYPRPMPTSRPQAPPNTSPALTVARGRRVHQDWVQIVLTKKAIPIRKVAPHIPQAMADVLDRALEIKAEKRYQHAGEMLAALERVA